MAISTASHWFLQNMNIEPQNTKKRGPAVSVIIAPETTSPATMTADHAQELGEALIEAAKIARRKPTL
jgi:hypothetical protein